ncbi:MAG TPA: hypothetical protein VN815_07290 [Steroidobacteraceae bacterium]|jgi:hypothetical protein|nr:hypothetical protein [Steroidobacteraceae bacterium]
MAGEKMWMRCAQVISLGAAMTLCACNKDSGSAAPAAEPAARVKPKPLPPKPGLSAAEQTAGMVQAAVLGKSQLPVELKFELAQRPKVGQAVDVNLALIAQVSASPATIQVAAGDDVSVAAGGNQFEIPAEEAGQVYRETLSVTPKAEGVVLLNVTVLLKRDELLDQRAFSIPIIAER